MGAVLVHRTMSLDGFVTGPEHEIGLVDEVIVQIAPVVLGDGIPFSPGSGRVDLELVDANPSPGVTTLRYRVKR